jgi:hypothetical protein
MGVGATGAPSVSMRLGNDDADRQKQEKQFNEEINQAKEATDDDVSSSETAPQRKAIGGWPTTQSLDTGPKFTDEQIYGETDAASKRIDEQIAEDRALSKRPYQNRLQHARSRVSDSMDTWGTTKYNATKMTGDKVWNYGLNNTWKDDQGREHPFFTESEKKAVYEDQKSKQQLAQQEQKEAYEREVARVQSDQYQNWVNQGDQLASPGPMVTGIAVCLSTGPYGCAVYSSAQTAPVVADAYNACKSGSTTDCVVGVAHATVAVVQDVGMIKSVQSKVPQVDPPSSSIPPGPTTSKSSPPGGTNAGAVSGEIVSRKLPDGAPHAPAQPKVVVDRSVEPGQAGKTKALGLDPSNTSAVAHASDGHGADFDVVASPARPGGPARQVGAGAAGGGAGGTGGGSGPAPTTTPATQSRDARTVSPSSSNAPTATAKPVYDISLNKNNVDWRGSGKTVDDAVNEAFKQTGVPIEKFRETKWVKTEYGKTVPVEWTGPGGAQVSIDVQHKSPAQDIPHVGWQGPGKGAPSGHIFLDQTPYGRAP